MHAQPTTLRPSTGLVLAQRQRDAALYLQAWQWMREAPELYGANAGADDYQAFMAYGEQAGIKDFFLLHDGELLAMASLEHTHGLNCRFALIAPPRPRLRLIWPLLQELERSFFETLRFFSYFVWLPPERSKARKLAQRFGMVESTPEIFEKRIDQYVAGQ